MGGGNNPQKPKNCKNGGFTFFIPGAKINPVMMSIQIHFRGSAIFFFFYKNCAIRRILIVSKYVINQKISNLRLILHKSKNYLAYQSSIPIQISMLARK